MAKFKAGQGAGCAGMLMGAAQGLRRRGAGGVGGSACRYLVRPQAPENRLMERQWGLIAQCSKGCWGHWWYWEGFGLLGG